MALGSLVLTRIRTVLAVIPRLELIVLILAAAVGMGMRLYLAVSYYGHSYDMYTWEFISNLTGSNIYLASGRFAYPPLYAHVLHFLREIQPVCGLPFPALLKTFLSMVDLLTALCLLFMFDPAHYRKGLVASVVFFLNPVTIMASGYWGQFDNVAFFPIVLALLLYETQSNGRPWFTIWLLGSLALATKHNTLFYVWMLYCCSSKTLFRAVVMMAASIAVLILTVYPYWADAGAQILNNTVHKFSDHHGTPRVLSAQPQQKLLLLCVLSVLPLYAGAAASALAGRVDVDGGVHLSFLYSDRKLLDLSDRAWLSFAGAWVLLYTLAAGLSFYGSTEAMNRLPIATRFEYLDYARLAAMGWLAMQMWPGKFLEIKIALFRKAIHEDAALP